MDLREGHTTQSITPLQNFSFRRKVFVLKKFLSKEKKKSDHVSVGMTSLGKVKALGLCIGTCNVQRDLFRFFEKLRINNNNMYQLKSF